MTHKIEARTWASKLRVLVDTEDGPQTVCEIPNPNPGELLSVVVGGWGDEVQTGYLRSVFVEPGGSQTIGELTQYEVNGVTPVRSAQGTTELPKVTATGGDIFEVVVDGEVKSRHSKQHVAQYEATKWEQASPSADVIYKKETVWRVEATPLDALPEVPDPLTRTDRNAAPYDVTVTPTDEPEEYNVSLLLRPSTGIPPTTPAVVLQPIAISVLEGDQQLTITLNDSGSQNHTGIELELDAVAVTGSPFAPGYSDPIVITGLTNDQAYSLTGRTTDGTNDSATTTRSATPSAGGSAVVLDPPTNIAANGGDGVINLSFTRNSQGESGVEYSFDGGINGTWNAIQGSAGVGNVRITGLDNGTQYSGFLRAVDGSQKGEQSAEWFATPQETTLGLNQSFWNPTTFIPEVRAAAAEVPGPMLDDQWMPTPYGVHFEFGSNAPYAGTNYPRYSWAEVGVDPRITDSASANAAVSAGRTAGFVYPGGIPVGRRYRQTMVNIDLKPDTLYDFAPGNGTSSLQNVSTIRTFRTLPAPDYPNLPASEAYGMPKAELDAAKSLWEQGDAIKVAMVDRLIANVGRFLGSPEQPYGGWQQGEFQVQTFACAYYMSGNTALRDEVRRLTLYWLPRDEFTERASDQYRRLQGHLFTIAGVMIGWDYGVSAADSLDIKNRLFAKATLHDNFNDGLGLTKSGDEDQQVATIEIIGFNCLAMIGDPTYGAEAAVRLEKVKRALYGSLLPRLWRANGPNGPMTACHAGGRVGMNPEYARGELGYYGGCFQLARVMSPNYMQQFIPWAYRQFLANDVFSSTPGQGYWFYHDLDDFNASSPPVASEMHYNFGEFGWGNDAGAMFMGALRNAGYTTEAEYMKKVFNDRDGTNLATGLYLTNRPNLMNALLYDDEFLVPRAFPPGFDQAYLDAGLGFVTSLNGLPLDQGGANAATQGLFFAAMDGGRDHWMPNSGMVSYWHDGRAHTSFCPYTSGTPGRFDTNLAPLFRVNGTFPETASYNSNGQKRFAGAPWWRVAEDVRDRYTLIVNETDAYWHWHRRLVFMYKADRTTGAVGGFIVVDRLFRKPSEPVITQMSQNFPMMTPVVATVTPLAGHSGPFVKLRDISSNDEQWEVPGTISDDVLMATAFVVNGPANTTFNDDGTNLTLAFESESVVVNRDSLELV